MESWRRDAHSAGRSESAESSCTSCGACVDTCPSGALEDRGRLEFGVATEWVRTTCPYCGTGCEMSVGTRDERIVAVKPVEDAPVSKGHLCVKGRYAFGFVSATDRITEPMIRRAGLWKTASWDEAVGFVADGFRALLERHRPDSVGVLGSARATNEENTSRRNSPAQCSARTTWTVAPVSVTRRVPLRSRRCGRRSVDQLLR